MFSRVSSIRHVKQACQPKQGKLGSLCRRCYRDGGSGGAHPVPPAARPPRSPGGTARHSATVFAAGSELIRIPARRLAARLSGTWDPSSRSKISTSRVFGESPRACFWMVGASKWAHAPDRARDESLRDRVPRSAFADRTAWLRSGCPRRRGRCRSGQWTIGAACVLRVKMTETVSTPDIRPGSRRTGPRASRG